jgi:L-asparagine oxygenase
MRSATITDETVRPHVAPRVLAVSDWRLPTIPDGPIDSDGFLAAAGHSGRLLPPTVHDALVDFADRTPDAGAIVLRGAPVGELPPTPPSPTAPTGKDLVSEFVLLTVGRRLGQPVGYLPEHGGDLVQNLVPTAASASRQVSTSSSVDLMFHTEAAFHPHRPRYLLLLCLRGNPEAVTTLSSVYEVLPRLPQSVVDVLFEARFRTAVDESYLHGRSNVLGPPMPVLRGERERPSMVFDADLMVGTDDAADAALRVLAAEVSRHHTGLALEPGDLLVVDNDAAVHGRTSFSARFDGSDRWIQRAMAVTDLAASASDRRGRVIATQFGA